MTPVDLLRTRLLEVLSGRASGVPAYVEELAQGDDAGFFPAGGAVWEVHRDISTLVAGPRALLMQALHPGAMAGVHDWSRYREDPFGRLTGTIRWITTVTYGSTEQAVGASSWVRHLHERVRGTFAGPDGRDVAYSAQDADLVGWVHIAFADSFLRSFQRYAGRPIPGGPDAYVREWAVAGELMGVPDPPRSVAELERRLGAIRASGVLRADDRVREAVRFLRRPPLPLALRPTYPAIHAGAVATLPPWAATMLHLRTPGPAAEFATRRVLASTARLLGGAAAPEYAGQRLAALPGGVPVQQPRSTLEAHS